MWFFSTKLLLFFISNLSWVENKETIVIKTSDESKENEFVEVLKNITSANQILQDLIKNYEQLQSIYRSDEEKSNSNSENDKNNLFKASPLSNENEFTTEPTTSRPSGITQMIFVGETDEENEDIESKHNASNIDAVESSEIKEVNPKVNRTIKEIALSEYYDETKENEKPNKTTRKERRKPAKQHASSNIEKVKTRFSVLNKESKEAKRHFKEIHPSLRVREPGVKTIKRIVYAEVFSPDKIWHEVIHKPIKLVHDDFNFRIPIKNKQEINTKKEISLTDSSDSKPDDDIIEKEKIKSYILRDAYGNACLQVAVRKCYKALKAVSKSVCRMRFKCKSSLKGSFIENAKRGCIREFANGKTNGNNKNLDDFIFERTVQKSDSDVSKFIDLCLPHLRADIDEKEDKHTTSGKDLETINVLRDRFEKACKKLSAKKCKKACKFATDEACKTHSCENMKKKAFKKACKSQCKAAYNLYSPSSESDDDESESGSD